MGFKSSRQNWPWVVGLQISLFPASVWFSGDENEFLFPSRCVPYPSPSEVCPIRLSPWPKSPPVALRGLMPTRFDFTFPERPACCGPGQIIYYIVCKFTDLNIWLHIGHLIFLYQSNTTTLFLVVKVHSQSALYFLPNFNCVVTNQWLTLILLIKIYSLNAQKQDCYLLWTW